MKQPISYSTSRFWYLKLLVIGMGRFEDGFINDINIEATNHQFWVYFCLVFWRGCMTSIWAIYYKSLTWMLFWVGFPYNHYLLGWPTGGKGRYKLPGLVAFYISVVQLKLIQQPWLSTEKKVSEFPLCYMCHGQKSRFIGHGTSHL